MKIRNFLLLIAAVMIAACSSPERKVLAQADSVMEENPDSAMSILNGLSRNDLKGDDLAYYSLLYTQAQVKTDVPLNSDSLISIAYAKYSGASRGDKGIRSNFYTGEVFFNQDQPRDAMRYYLTAYEESKRLGNDYWRAKSAERIADLFFFAYNYDEAEKYAREAVLYFDKSNRQINHRYSLGQLAIICLNNGDYDVAYTILDSLNNLKDSLVDSTFHNFIRHPLLEAMFKTGKLDNIELDSIEPYRDDMSSREILDAAILKSELLENYDRNYEINDMLRNVEYLALTHDDKVQILYTKYGNAKAMGDNIFALSLVDSLLYHQNFVAEKIIKESVTSAQRDFYSDRSTLHEHKTTFLKSLLYSLLALFVVIVAFIVTVFHLRNKVQKAELKANMESLLSLKLLSDRIISEKKELEKSVYEKSEVIQSLLETKKSEDIIHAEIVERLFKEKWITLDLLCNQYFSLNNSELNDRNVLANMEKELKRIVSKKGLAEIVESVDTYMGGIVTLLRDQCPFLKDEDINFLALIYAGFSVRAVCMFTGIQYQHFYVKKSRLIKRIQNSVAPDKEQFVARLKKQ